LSQLHAYTRTHIFHKTKEDCLKDLPPKTREYKRVPVSSRYEIQHANAMNELAKVQADSQRNKDSEAILGAFMRLRQVASYSKIDATVALANSILEKEPSIVIFTNFVKVAKEVHSKLGESGWTGELLTGETPQKKRQGMVDNFQVSLIHQLIEMNQRRKAFRQCLYVHLVQVVWV
jgi:SNF2 family DNA or RNA helicase